MDAQLTTPARKRTKRLNIIRFGTWNIASWNKRDQEVVKELEYHKIEICALSETKKKGKGSININNTYILLHSGVSKDKRAQGGVGLLVHRKFENNITDIKYINEHMMMVTLKLENTMLNLIPVYAPDTSKSKEEKETFYGNLQELLDATNTNTKTIILGDLNARVGNVPIGGVKQRFNEEALNENGERLIETCLTNNLRINNTYFDHSIQHKITWSDTRGRNSMIDYIITNREIHPQNIIDVRTLSSANIGSDHGLVLGKIDLKITPAKPRQTRNEERINIESLENDGTKILYQTRLAEKLNIQNLDTAEDTEEIWEHIESSVHRAAKEALGRREVKRNKREYKTPWFDERVKTLAEEKKQAFLNLKRKQTPEAREEYVTIRNRVNQRIDNIKKEHWEKFTKDMEHDLYGSQRKVWKMIRRQRKDMNEFVRIENVTEEQWIECFTNLYGETEEESNEETYNEDNNDGGVIQITEEELNNRIKKLRNRKAPGPDGIHNELMKYGGMALHEWILKLFNNIISKGKIPKKWKESLLLPIFKKGDRIKPENYRGISLMNSALKLLTAIIKDKLEEHVETAEEQQGFRKNRSTIDATFIIRQVVEKSIEYNKPAYICFVDLKSAFDRVRRNDILKLLETQKVKHQLIRLIEDINKDNKTKIIMQNNETKHIPLKGGIRQGDSLSPLLFNMIMNRIIVEVKKREGYRLGQHKVNIVCYADDALLIADNEDDLQRQLHTFNITAKKYNMNISPEKTKCMVISRDPRRCKLEVEGKIIEQVMTFTYLGIDITSDRNVTTEVKRQITKATKVSGCLRETIWKNKYLSTESKLRVYKTTVRPIMTYATETRADTKKTKQLMSNLEMKILRSIQGISLRDQQTNKSIREQCKIQNINKWTKTRKKEWKDHVNRMDYTRLARICKDNKPYSRRPVGRPKKRWIDNIMSTTTTTETE